MSTEKSLKHLKSQDKFLVANVSNYFEKNSGRDSSSYIQHTFQATGVRRRTVFRVRKELRETGTLSSPQRSKRGQYKYVLKRVSFGSKDCTKELKLECAYFLGQTS